MAIPKGVASGNDFNGKHSESLRFRERLNLIPLVNPNSKTERLGPRSSTQFNIQDQGASRTTADQPVAISEDSVKRGGQSPTKDDDPLSPQKLTRSSSSKRSATKRRVIDDEDDDYDRNVELSSLQQRRKRHRPAIDNSLNESDRSLSTVSGAENPKQLADFVCTQCKKGCPHYFGIKMKFKKLDPRCIQCRAPQRIVGKLKHKMKLTEKIEGEGHHPPPSIIQNVKEFYDSWLKHVWKKGFIVPGKTVEELYEKATVEVLPIISQDPAFDASTFQMMRDAITKTAVDHDGDVSMPNESAQTARQQAPRSEINVQPEMNLESSDKVAEPDSSLLSADFFERWIGKVSSEKDWIAPKIFDGFTEEAKDLIAQIESLASRVKRKADAEKKRHEEGETE